MHRGHQRHRLVTPGKAGHRVDDHRTGLGHGAPQPTVSLGHDQAEIPGLGQRVEVGSFQMPPLESFRPLAAPRCSKRIDFG